MGDASYPGMARGTLGTIRFPPVIDTARPPYRCPICEGKGTVAPNFYPDRGFTPIGQRPKCRACSGRGIVR